MKRILYIQYTNPGGYPPLEHSSRILAKADWKVLFLGTGTSGSNSLDFPMHENITVRRMSFCGGGWRQKLHFGSYCFWVLWSILTWRPDWVYASDPFSCPLAALAICMPGVRVLYHEHDAPANNSGSQFLRFILRARRYVARHAEICVLPNAARLERFKLECGPLKASECVWNCPALSEVSGPREEVAASVWLLYHGSIVPERLPPTALDALALLPPTVRMRVVGYETVGSRGYVGELQRRARESGLESRVEFLGTLPQRSDLLRTTLRSDIGLALMPLNSTDHNCETMAGASNKAFDYLACGVPLIVSDLAEWKNFFVEPGYGLACDPTKPESIAGAISKLIGNLEVMRQMGDAGRLRILSEWNYENKFFPVFQFLSATESSQASVPSREKSSEANT